MKRTMVLAVLLLSAGIAHAQLGDILNKVNKIDPNRVRKGAKVAREMTRDFTEEEEIRIGRIVAARILATYPLSENQRLHKYVTLVGNTVAAYSSRPALEWHFAVLETPVVNAFSAPGGYLFITTGALDEVTSEAELAAVIGHEIAHATEKHILREIKRANVLAAGVDLAQSEVGRGGLTDGLARKIADVANEKLFKTGIGRREELDADRVGVQLAAAAGYRASAYLHFLESLSALSKSRSSAFAQLGATHPRPEDRIKAIRPVAGKEDKGQLLAERWATWSGQAPR